MCAKQVTASGLILVQSALKYFILVPERSYQNETGTKVNRIIEIAIILSVILLQNANNNKIPALIFNLSMFHVATMSCFSPFSCHTQYAMPYSKTVCAYGVPSPNEPAAVPIRFNVFAFADQL